VKLYFAGNFERDYLSREADDQRVARNFLVAYDNKPLRFAERACTRSERRLFIDSGAYSVWTQGKPIDIDSYIKFCLHMETISKCPIVFAALDVIPGTGSSLPTDKEREVACEKGWENYEYMRKKGVECLMTFHQLERTHWLKKILSSSDHFCASSRKRGVSNEQKLAWLKEVFNYAPVGTKIHGLGISSAEFMRTVPFYSVDNSAWVQSGRVANHSSFDEKEMRVGTTSSFNSRGEPETSSTYVYIDQAIEAYLKLERRMTEFWQLNNVFWDDEPRIQNLGSSNPRLAELATYDWQTACGRSEQLGIPGFEEYLDDEDETWS
jgi:hypothetical protein